VHQFYQCWAALLASVADLPDQAFDEPSGCSGWLVRDLVCHLVIDVQDVLKTWRRRRRATDEETAVLGELAAALPVFLG